MENRFDLDLFGFNLHGLASYIEPDGWSELNLMSRPRAKSYATRCPASSLLAKTVYDSLGETSRWGHQLSHGGWVTYTEGLATGRFRVKSKASITEPHFVEPIADRLRLHDVLKHLHGRRCALGTTDRPEMDPFQLSKGIALYDGVSCLRIDVDQDEDWLYERRAEVLAELRDQRRIVEAMGLEYLVFKTGGRGVQIMVPLPCALEPVVASLLSRGLRMALRGRTGLKGIHVDRDSFDGLLRLPGGVHARGNTGLFIDVERGELSPVEHQVEILGRCLGERRRPSEAGNQLLEAQEDLIRRAGKTLAAAYAVCDDATVLMVLKQARENPICAMVRRALEASGAVSTLAAGRRRGRRLPATGRRSIGLLDRAWAEETWAKTVLPGGWWDWIQMNGDMGILSATLLFGPERAEEMLLQKAASHPTASRTDQREREAMTRGLWKSFRLKDFKLPTKSISMALVEMDGLDPDVVAFAQKTVFESLNAATTLHKQKALRLSTILAIVLQSIVDSDEGEVALSLRDLERLMRKFAPEDAVSHVTIRGLLPSIARISEGIDWSMVMCDRSHVHREGDEQPPMVEALVRCAACSAKGEKPVFLPGTATRDWVELRLREKREGFTYC